MNVLAVLIGLGVHIGIPAILLWKLFGKGEGALLFAPALVAGAVGWNLLVAQVCDIMSVPVDSRSAIASYVVLGAAAWAKHLHGATGLIRSQGPVWGPASSAVAASVVAGGLIWMALLVGAGATPPYQDSVHHAYMTRKIDELHTVDPETVASLDVEGTILSAQYYPLGLHATTALAHQTSGARIDYLLFGWVVVAGALLFPLGSFMYPRALAEDDLAAAFAAITAVCVVEMPYLIYAWGGIPTVVGTALAPGVAVGMAEAARREKSSGLLVILAFAFAGLFVMSNNLVFLPAGLGACLAFREPRSQGVRELRRRALRLTLAATATVLLVAPSLRAVWNGVDERYAIVPTATGTTSELLAELATGRLELGIAQVATSALAAVGLTVLLLRKQWGLVALAIGIVALAVVAWSPDAGFLRNLAFPWYRSAYRIAYLLTVIKVIAAGVGAAALLRGWRSSSSRIKVPARLAVVSLGVIVLATLPSLVGFASDRTLSAIDSGVVINDASRRAFEQLRLQNGNTATVVGEYCDESTWMYAYEGVPPLFGLLTPNPEGIPEVNARVELLDHLNAGGDPRTLAITNELDLRFLYFGEKSICATGERFLSLSGLRANPYLIETFDEDGAHIFEFMPAPPRG